MKKYDIAIIGGGAAGLMAAQAASQNKNKSIIIIEKNEKLGKKIYITGKGRCNVTNNSDLSIFFDNITRNPEFMYSSIYTFSNIDTIKFFESKGVPLKTERGNRVFPNSDKSSDIIKALASLNKNVDISLNNEVIDVYRSNDIFHIKAIKGEYTSEKLIIATGGLSYPGTGSTGEGYKFSRKLGHSIIDLKPSLCPIILDDENLSIVTGLTIKNCELNVFVNNKKTISYFGDFLFTHKGISGPIILTLSDYLTELSEKDQIELYCNFKPSVEIDILERRLLADIDNNPKKSLKNILQNYFPNSLVDYLLENSGIDPNIKMHSIDRALRKKILNLMTNYKFNYHSIANISLAVITKGGVNTLEIDPSTMESKICENLYFGGEIIDVNGLTGGYNLQIAFSTGYLAGISASSN